MTEPLLALEHVYKSFGALKATNDVSLDLRPGEIHALIGPNGAGKSTLIHQVTGFLAPDSGSIRFLNRDVSHMTVAQRARAGLGRTFQVSSLIGEFSVLRNVMLAAQSVSGSSFRFFRPAAGDQSLQDPAREALAQVGLTAREDVQ
ncbi:MAG: ATP-binding cassette domain-containing protein, partial [Pseudomonadota bacterium]